MFSYLQCINVDTTFFQQSSWQFQPYNVAREFHNHLNKMHILFFYFLYQQSLTQGSKCIDRR